LRARQERPDGQARAIVARTHNVKRRLEVTSRYSQGVRHE
jgi:hypothetical protein